MGKQETKETTKGSVLVTTTRNIGKFCRETDQNMRGRKKERRVGKCNWYPWRVERK